MKVSALHENMTDENRQHFSTGGGWRWKKYDNLIKLLFAMRRFSFPATFRKLTNISVHTSNIRVHATKYGNVQVIYQYIGYIRMCRSNKHEVYHFSLYISFLHVLGSCLPYMQVPHARVPHTCATLVYHAQRLKYTSKNSFEKKWCLCTKMWNKFMCKLF